MPRFSKIRRETGSRSSAGSETVRVDDGAESYPVSVAAGVESAGPFAGASVAAEGALVAGAGGSVGAAGVASGAALALCGTSLGSAYGEAVGAAANGTLAER